MTEAAACALALALLPLASRAGARGLGALAVLSLLWFVGPGVGRLHVWNLFHYTIGAKFFAELGYHDLYRGALAADEAGDRSLDQVRHVRDLHTYRIVARKDLPRWDAGAHLTPERLDDLRRTVDALEPLLAARTWTEVFIDRGYNATPAYTAVAGPVATALPAYDPVARRLSTLLDPAALAVGLGLVFAAFGVEAGFLVLLLVAVWPGTHERLVGGFLAYDWLAALLVALAAIRRERPVLCAAALSWATASRLFPGLLAASLLLPAARAVVRREPVPSFDRAFAGAFAAFGALWVAVGCLTPRGPAAWAEFVPRFLHHAAAHASGEQRVGLRHLLTLSPDSLDTAVRLALVEERTALWAVLAALGLAGWGAAAARRSREEAFLLGWVPVFLVAVSSRYYWVGLALVGVLPGARGRWLAGALVALAAAAHLGEATGVPDYWRWVGIDAVLFVVLGSWAATRPRA